MILYFVTLLPYIQNPMYLLLISLCLNEEVPHMRSSYVYIHQMMWSMWVVHDYQHLVPPHTVLKTIFDFGRGHVFRKFSVVSEKVVIIANSSDLSGENNCNSLNSQHGKQGTWSVIPEHGEREVFVKIRKRLGYLQKQISDREILHTCISMDSLKTVCR